MARPNIVLVHGAWADGSCWSAVIERLQADGCYGEGPLFVWGFAPEIYVESGLRPASRYVMPQAPLTGGTIPVAPVAVVDPARRPDQGR